VALQLPVIPQQGNFVYFYMKKFLLGLIVVFCLATAVASQAQGAAAGHHHHHHHHHPHA
jgi:hypothetical protein